MLVFYTVLALVIVAGCVFLVKAKYAPHVTALSIAILAAMLAPWGVYSITAAVAKNDDQTFSEYWNGSESSVSATPVQCSRDGFCKHNYDCDPYTVTHVETSTDSKGKTSTRIVTTTEYHHCPYSNEETDFIINTTVGPFTAGSAVMTGDKFRGDREIPGGRQSAPSAWVEAKQRIESGNPAGVTSRHPYKNFILAADSTLFKNYSDKIDNLLGKNLLPAPSASIQGLYSANKAYSAGDTKLDMNSMNDQLAHLNGYVGAELHGDMHIVFVESAQAGDPTDYTNALKAHWTSPAIGKNAIAKNTLTLVVGVVQKDNKPVVDWAKGFTGMPLGNEALIQQFSNLKGDVIDGNFIGATKYDPSAKKYVMSGGKVESMISGPNKFVRMSMSGNDTTANGAGFSYLSDSWEMKPEALAVAIWISSIMSVILLTIGTVISVKMGNDFKDPVRKFTKNVFSKN